MRAAGRLAAIESSLSPSQLILRWLDEAHGHGSMATYVRAILDEVGAEWPLDRLCREADEGARTKLRGKPRDQVRDGMWAAVRQTVFRYELVLRLNVTTHELLEREVLVEALLRAQLDLLLCDEPTQRRRDPRYRPQFGQLLGLISLRVTELLAQRDARADVEGRYLAGHSALFPDLAGAFDEQLTRSQALTDMATDLAGIEGVPAQEPADPGCVSARADGLAADLVQQAHADALQKLGEGARAIRIATEWVRSKLGPVAEEPPDDSTP